MQPETVVRRHDQRFRAYWSSISTPGPGRPRISNETRALIGRLAIENRWRAREIQDELSKLGIPVTHRFLILDDDAIFSPQVAGSISSPGLAPKRTAFQSPWQNGTPERFVGSVPRELLDHIVVLSEDHLRRLLREYIGYYDTERVHTAISDAPAGANPSLAPHPTPGSSPCRVPVACRWRVCGLHHRHSWRDAA